MNSASKGVFLCPECEAVASVNEDGYVVCSACDYRSQLPKEVKTLADTKGFLFEKKASSVERNISVKPSAVKPVLEKAAESNLPVAQLTAEPSLKRRRRTKQRKNKKEVSVRKYLIILALWLGGVTLVFFVVMQVRKQLDSQRGRTLSVEQKLDGNQKQFFRAEYPSVYNQFVLFLRSQSDLQKSEYVLNVDQLSRKMRAHYLDNIDESFSPQMKEAPLFWNVAYEESPGFVEVLLGDGEDGVEEAVFVKEGGEWLLDWEQYVRYSEQSWALFCEEPGDELEGVFRLYVERLGEVNEDDKSWIEVRLYGAIQDENRRKGEASEVIKLDLDSPVLAKLEHLFVDRIGGSEGFSQLWKRDPKKLRRATLSLAWSNDSETGKDILVIKDILSHNWRTITDFSASVEDK